MPNRNIQMTQEEWDQFYESQGSRYLQLESATLKAHGDDQKKLFYEIFNSTTKLVQAIGVVAGFGFTGLGFVKTNSLFLIGEGLLFTAILVGLWWTQKVYRSNLDGSRGEVTRIKGFFRDRHTSFMKIYDKALADIEGGRGIEVPEADIRALMRKDNELMEHFTEEKADEAGSDMLPLLMVLFALGGIALLLSFVHFCF
ncbi:MAG TPA: hypothetical protein VMH91_02070 [Candidatus Paceibacterota bacterium]|nr:hypothetical protein [Candidatus Paceibacterota bacterium]